MESRARAAQPPPGARAPPFTGPAEGDPPSRCPNLVHSTSCAHGLRTPGLPTKRTIAVGRWSSRCHPHVPPPAGERLVQARPHAHLEAVRRAMPWACVTAPAPPTPTSSTDRGIGPGLPGPFHRGCERRLSPAPTLWAPLCGVLLPFDVILELRRSAKGQARRLCRPPRGVNEPLDRDRASARTPSFSGDQLQDLVHRVVQAALGVHDHRAETAGTLDLVGGHREAF